MDPSIQVIRFITGILQRVRSNLTVLSDLLGLKARLFLKKVVYGYHRLRYMSNKG